jgi:hypothetical protein
MKNVSLLLVALIIFSDILAQKITEFKTKDLPKSIEKYINVNMPGSTIFKAVKLDHNDKVTYSVAIDVRGKKQILVFDKNGKFLKKGDDLKSPVNKPGVNNTNQKTNSQQETTPAQKSKTDDQNNPKK